MSNRDTGVLSLSPTHRVPRHRLLCCSRLSMNVIINSQT